jgi:hypothetical protein
VLDDKVLTPETIKEPETIIESEPEIIISSADDKEPVSHETTTEKSGAKFPWRFLLMLLLFALIAALAYFLSKRKKAKPAESVKAEPEKEESVEEAPAAASVINTMRTVNLDEEIRLRAYELYLERGSQDGNMDGDWYRAETEICAKYKTDGYQTYFDGVSFQASLQETKPA